MNIVQIHERVRFWLDRVGTTRFESADIDNAINAAMLSIVEEKYSGSRIAPGDSFQKTQKLRDELSNIVKISDSSSPGIVLSNSTGNSLITKASLPADYKYLLAIAFYQTASLKHNCWPLSYDRENVIDSNPYRRVRTGPFPKLYFNESSLGINIKHPFTTTPPNKVVIYYLAKPIDFVYGIQRDSTYTFTVNPTPVIVDSLTCVYNGLTKQLGTEFNITAPTSITSGTVVSDFTESDINSNVHELIARRGAINCLLSINESEKAVSLIKFYEKG